MLAAISGLDSAPVAEQQAGYSGQAEIAVQMERENSIECLQVPMPGQPTEPFFRPNPSGLSSSPTGSLGFDLEGQGTNDAAFAKYDGYVPYDVESHGTNGAIFVQYDLEGQGTDSITKRIDKVAEDSWKVEELAGEATEPFFRPNPAGDGTTVDQATEPFYRPNPIGLSSSPTGSLGFDVEGQGTNDAVFAKYDGYVPYDSPGDDVAANAPPTEDSSNGPCRAMPAPPRNGHALGVLT